MKNLSKVMHEVLMNVSTFQENLSALALFFISLHVVNVFYLLSAQFSSGGKRSDSFFFYPFL